MYDDGGGSSDRSSVDPGDQSFDIVASEGQMHVPESTVILLEPQTTEAREKLAGIFEGLVKQSETSFSYKTDFFMLVTHDKEKSRAIVDELLKHRGLKAVVNGERMIRDIH